MKYHDKRQHQFDELRKEIFFDVDEILAKAPGLSIKLVGTAPQKTRLGLFIYSVSLLPSADTGEIGANIFVHHEKGVTRLAEMWFEDIMDVLELVENEAEPLIQKPDLLP